MKDTIAETIILVSIVSIAVACMAIYLGAALAVYGG